MLTGRYAHVLISAFVVLTVLYYFLRFQTGLVNEFAIMQVLLLAVMAMLGGLNLYKFGVFPRGVSSFSNINSVVLLLLVHGVLFLPYLYIRDGAYETMHSAKTTILPFMIFWFFYHLQHNRRLVLNVIEFVLLFVALLYIAEFFNKMILKQGYFEYSIALNRYVVNQFGGEGVSASWVEGDLYTLIRMAGPLSHNNTTGLAIALGLVLSVSKQLVLRKRYAFITSVVFAVALLLTGARTAVLAAALGIVVVYVSLHGVTEALKNTYKLLIVIPVGVGIVMTLLQFGVIDIMAFGSVFNTSSSATSIGMMFGKSTFGYYFDQVLSNPVSLFTGLGHSGPNFRDYPGMSSLSDDDVFFMSVISHYGIILPSMLIVTVFVRTQSILQIARNNLSRDGLFILLASYGAVVLCLISTVHTDAMLRPQLFPLFIIFLAYISALSVSAINRHQYKASIKIPHPPLKLIEP
jgi:hypothetical protein